MKTMNVIVASVLIVLIIGVVDYYYDTLANQTPKSACPMIPAYPTKEQVLAYINQSYNGSCCAMAALSIYKSNGILANYSLNWTQPQNANCEGAWS